MNVFFKKDKSNVEDHALAEYKLALHNIESLVYDYCTRGGDKREILDFTIGVVRRDLVSSKTARFFYEGEYPRDFLCQIPVVGFVDEIKRQTIDTTHLDVLTGPYQKDKALCAVKDLTQTKFDQSLSNYDGIYYPEIKLAIISNGVHHTNAAKELGHEVAMTADILPLTEAYGKLKTDGRKWFLPNGAEISVSDYRLALLFTLAEMRDHNFQVLSLTLNFTQRIMTI